MSELGIENLEEHLVLPPIIMTRYTVFDLCKINLGPALTKKNSYVCMHAYLYQQEIKTWQKT